MIAWQTPKFRPTLILISIIVIELFFISIFPTDFSNITIDYTPACRQGRDFGQITQIHTSFLVPPLKLGKQGDKFYISLVKILELYDQGGNIDDLRSKLEAGFPKGVFKWDDVELEGIEGLVFRLKFGEERRYSLVDKNGTITITRIDITPHEIELTRLDNGAIQVPSSLTASEQVAAAQGTKATQHIATLSVSKTSTTETQINPIALLQTNPDLRNFIERLLTRRYISWGLPKDLAKRIIDTLAQYGNNPEEARLQSYKEVVNFPNSDEDLLNTSRDVEREWRRAYKDYKKATKYATTYAQVEPFLKGLPDGTVIFDVGAGDNSLNKEIIERNPGYVVIGTDIGDYRDEKDRTLVNPGFKLQENPLVLPFDDESADVVVMNAMLHHISAKDMPTFLREIFRVLKPGGRVILVEDTYSLVNPVEDVGADEEFSEEFSELVKKHGDEFAQAFFSFNDWYANIVVHKWVGMPLEFNFYSMEKWSELFHGYGFSLFGSRYLGFPAKSFHKPSIGVLAFSKGNTKAQAETAAPAAARERLEINWRSIFGHALLDEIPTRLTYIWAPIQNLRGSLNILICDEELYNALDKLMNIIKTEKEKIETLKTARLTPEKIIGEIPQLRSPEEVAEIFREASEAISKYLPSLRSKVKELLEDAAASEEVKENLKYLNGKLKEGHFELVNRILEAQVMFLQRKPSERYVSLKEIWEEFVRRMNERVPKVSLDKKMLNKFWQERKVEIQFDAESFYVLISPLLLERIFGEMISNAVLKNEGKDNLRVTVKVSEKSDNDGLSWITIAIEDNGKGIPSEMLKVNAVSGRQKLFTLEGTTTGGGVGLTEAYLVITDAGGTLKADNESALGGARFLITLPEASKTKSERDGLDLFSAESRFSVLSQEQVQQQMPHLSDIIDRGLLIGFTRDANGKIIPVAGTNNAEFKSQRSIQRFSGESSLNRPSYNPKRRVQIIPLTAEKKVFTQFETSEEFQRLPTHIRELFIEGNLLITAPPETLNTSKYSVAMVVTPEVEVTGMFLQGKMTLGKQGRTGVILYQKYPIIFEDIATGKQLIMEGKLIGNPDGGYDFNDPAFSIDDGIRGGGHTNQADREFKSLQHQREDDPDFKNADTVRNLADIHFKGKRGEQGYLLRLSPATIRSTFVDNDGLPKIESRTISYQMGREIARLLSLNLLPIVHPENLLIVENFDEWTLTDSSDNWPFAAFPTQIEGPFFNGLKWALLQCLEITQETPTYDKSNFEAFKKGLAYGLKQKKMIEEITEVTSLESFEAIRDLLWTKVIMWRYFEECKKRENNLSVSVESLKAEGGGLALGYLKEEKNFLNELLMDAQKRQLKEMISEIEEMLAYIEAIERQIWDNFDRYKKGETEQIVNFLNAIYNKSKRDKILSEQEKGSDLFSQPPTTELPFAIRFIRKAVDAMRKRL